MANNNHAESSIYLCAPINALVEGIYEEHIRLSEIKRHGDFGVGTFHDLNGEMIMLDGEIYRITSDGRVSVAKDEDLTPFACVTFFKPHSTYKIDTGLDYGGFIDFINGCFPSPNLFYGVRFKGVSNYVKTRVVPRTKNHRPLVEVAEQQPTFEFQEIEGTVAGFFTPSFMASLNVPGLHLHFLSSDLRHGGHLLDCRPGEGELSIQYISKMELSLPMSRDYLTHDFTRDARADLEKAES